MKTRNPWQQSCAFGKANCICVLFLLKFLIWSISRAAPTQARQIMETFAQLDPS